MLVMEFAGDTTLHGIRFLAQPTKFLLRRFNDLTAITSLHKRYSYLAQV